RARACPVPTNVRMPEVSPLRRPRGTSHPRYVVGRGIGRPRVAVRRGHATRATARGSVISFSSPRRSGVAQDTADPPPGGGVKWHDGTPMVADDWVFGWEVDHDPSMPNYTTVPVRYVDNATAPDDTTLVLRWSQTYPHADALLRENLNPMQRAKHEALFRAD